MTSRSSICREPFPAVTILQVEALLEQLRSILAQVTLAVEYVLLLVLAAGMAVLFSGLQATLDERIRQGALLRALGAERKLLVKARRIEFGLLGAVSGLLAALGYRTGEPGAVPLCLRPELAPSSMAVCCCR